MKILIMTLILAPMTAYSSCNTGAIEFVRRTGFGISFSGGSSSAFNQGETVNVHLTIDGREACFKKVSKFEVKAEEKKDINKFDISVKPLKVEFTNVPDAHVKQYLYIEKHPTIPALTKFHTMSFICSGNIPLSVEAASDSYLEVLNKSQSVEVGTRMVFATGAAAENLKKAQRGISNSQVTFDFFSNLYASKTDRPLEEAPACEYNIPSILSETSVSVLSNLHREIATSYTTMGAKVANGCTEDFSKNMNNYLIENFKNNESLESFKTRKNFKNEILISN